jgi:hypothetical protein
LRRLEGWGLRVWEAVVGGSRGWDETTHRTQHNDAEKSAVTQPRACSQKIPCGKFVPHFSTFMYACCTCCMWYFCWAEETCVPINRPSMRGNKPHHHHQHRYGTALLGKAAYKSSELRGGRVISSCHLTTTLPHPPHSFLHHYQWVDLQAVRHAPLRAPPPAPLHAPPRRPPDRRHRPRCLHDRQP